MAYRTDLALEALETHADAAGVVRHETEREGFAVTGVDIETEAGARALGKPCGRYRTLDLGALVRREEDAFPRAVEALAALLTELLDPLPGDGPVLAVGLGNRSITPDAIGPQAIGHVVATRHLIGSAPDYFSAWRSVAALAPGVLGQTGVEAAELVRGVLRTVRPAAVIAVDALAAGRLSRLCRTIQVTDAGIIPGSGVGNGRAAFSQDALGVPVVAVGVPTVVDGGTLAHEIRAQSGAACEALDDLAAPLFVTTRDIDREVGDVSRVIGYAIDRALHPHLSVDDIDLCLS